MLQNKKTLIVIAGPTASGKTELSIKLAKKINGEIISGDSMQVYKHLDIGTAKITKDEMENVPHHLIDIIEPNEEYNVQIFQKNAKKIIEDIYSRGKIPIIAGGTGLYIDALVYNYSFIDEDNDSKIRDKLWEDYYNFGVDYLVKKLQIADPDALNLIDLSNIKRLIRALEISEKNKIKYSELERDSRTEKTSQYDLFYFVITMNRDVLYDRINKRVDLMFENGWLSEVNSLLESGKVLPDFRSMQGLGYREILEFLNSGIPFEECVEKIKQNTRRFAKRQLTWFRKNKDIIWLDKSLKNSEELLEEIIHIYNDKCREEV
ncbi:MAG: tRNA (adenosine(37)-N6)-dimethylallyltransferase MiaA [Clostridia bacterium]|nr:tRNA (adenosine(37)-N6)-dimethylallyltransferase MiaA [Clostridia bacterium]